MKKWRLCDEKSHNLHSDFRGSEAHVFHFVVEKALKIVSVTQKGRLTTWSRFGLSLKNHLVCNLGKHTGIGSICGVG